MAALTERYPHRLATGENLFSVSDVKNLVRFGQMWPNFDLFQMDPGLSYGFGEFVKMIDMMEAQGYSQLDVHPHGGHMMALHIVVGLGLGSSEAYPGVFSPFGGYTAGCHIADGGVAPSRAPGFGLEEKTDLYPHIQTLLCM